MVLLTGCQTTAVKKQTTAPAVDAELRALSEVRAKMIARLPTDADLTRLQEQYEEIPIGYYWDWEGKRKAIRFERSAELKSRQANAPSGPKSIDWNTRPDSTQGSRVKIDLMR
jgi:hypothetical protein